ncbi:hypothetical protein [Roseinatronobacter alkalisoli]|nr:hypothetical protein [Roseinatronobacter sp. HJB301]
MWSAHAVGLRPRKAMPELVFANRSVGATSSHDADAPPREMML